MLTVTEAVETGSSSSSRSSSIRYAELGKQVDQHTVYIL